MKGLIYKAHLWVILFSLFLVSCSNSNDLDLLEENQDLITRGPYMDTPSYYSILQDSLRTGIPYPEDAYVYPMSPMNESYEDLKIEKGWSVIDAMNVIPEATLKSMSTAALIQAVMEYPGALARLTESFNDCYEVKESLKKIGPNQELLNREDAPKELIKDLQRICKWADTGDYIAQTLHMMLGQEEILSQLSSEDTYNLVEALKWEIFTSGYNNVAFMSQIRMMEGFILLGNVLQRENYAPFVQYLENNPDQKSVLETYKYENWAYWANNSIQLEWMGFADDFLRDIKQ